MTAPQVLVVDDNPAIRHFVRDVLEGAGYRVKTAQDGLDALQQVSASPAKLHLLLTDIAMPEWHRLGR